MQNLPKAADQEWRKKAKEYIQWVKSNVSDEERRLKSILGGIEDLASEEFQEDLSNGITDRV